MAGLAIGLAGAPARQASAQSAQGPHASLACGRCHALDADGALLRPARMRAPQQSLCGGCHAEIGGRGHGGSHPVGMVPARPLPAAYPTDADGRFACSSCHDPHAATPALLRSGRGWACTDCHPR